jgi:hypothetical protein
MLPETPLGTLSDVREIDSKTADVTVKSRVAEMDFPFWGVLRGHRLRDV